MEEGTFWSYTHLMDTKEQVQANSSACEAMTDAQDDLARDIMSRIAGKWPLWILHVLAASDRPVRFSRIKEEVEGVSQKVLTQALRQLEADGLVTRTIFAQVPPRVEYALTPLGAELLRVVSPVWGWVVSRIATFEAARARFAARDAAAR